MKRIFIFIALSSAVFLGCDETVDHNREDDIEIKQYIEDNNLNAVKTESDLYYVIENEGTGVRPTSTSKVKVIYKGYLTDGSVFDETTTALSFSLTGVIKGWQEGIPKFREGGNGKLLIPSKLGYGGQNITDIPPYSVLIFDIELVEVL